MPPVTLTTDHLQGSTNGAVAKLRDEDNYAFFPSNSILKKVHLLAAIKLNDEDSSQTLAEQFRETHEQAFVSTNGQHQRQMAELIHRYLPSHLSLPALLGSAEKLSEEQLANQTLPTLVAQIQSQTAEQYFASLTGNHQIFKDFGRSLADVNGVKLIELFNQTFYEQQLDPKEKIKWDVNDARCYPLAVQLMRDILGLANSPEDNIQLRHLFEQYDQGLSYLLARPLEAYLVNNAEHLGLEAPILVPDGREMLLCRITRDAEGTIHCSAENTLTYLSVGSERVFYRFPVEIKAVGTLATDTFRFEHFELTGEQAESVAKTCRGEAEPFAGIEWKKVTFAEALQYKGYNKKRASLLAADKAATSEFSNDLSLWEELSGHSREYPEQEDGGFEREKQKLEQELPATLTTLVQASQSGAHEQLPAVNDIDWSVIVKLVTMLEQRCQRGFDHLQAINVRSEPDSALTMSELKLNIIKLRLLLNRVLDPAEYQTEENPQQHFTALLQQCQIKVRQVAEFTGKQLKRHPELNRPLDGMSLNDYFSVSQLLMENTRVEIEFNGLPTDNKLKSFYASHPEFAELARLFWQQSTELLAPLFGCPQSEQSASQTSIQSTHLFTLLEWQKTVVAFYSVEAFKCCKSDFEFQLQFMTLLTSVLDGQMTLPDSYQPDFVDVQEQWQPLLPAQITQLGVQAETSWTAAQAALSGDTKLSELLGQRHYQAYISSIKACCDQLIAHLQPGLADKAVALFTLKLMTQIYNVIEELIALQDPNTYVHSQNHGRSAQAYLNRAEKKLSALEQSLKNAQKKCPQLDLKIAGLAANDFIQQSRLQAKNAQRVAAFAALPANDKLNQFYLRNVHERTVAERLCGEVQAIITTLLLEKEGSGKSDEQIAEINRRLLQFLQLQEKVLNLYDKDEFKHFETDADYLQKFSELAEMLLGQAKNMIALLASKAPSSDILRTINQDLEGMVQALYNRKGHYFATGQNRLAVAVCLGLVKPPGSLLNPLHFLNPRWWKKRARYQAYADKTINEIYSEAEEKYPPEHESTPEQQFFIALKAFFAGGAPQDYWNSLVMLNRCQHDAAVSAGIGSHIYWREARRQTCSQHLLDSFDALQRLDKSNEVYERMAEPTYRERLRQQFLQNIQRAQKSWQNIEGKVVTGEVLSAKTRQRGTFIKVLADEMSWVRDKRPLADFEINGINAYRRHRLARAAKESALLADDLEAIENYRAEERLIGGLSARGAR